MFIGTWVRVGFVYELEAIKDETNKYIVLNIYRTLESIYSKLSKFYMFDNCFMPTIGADVGNVIQYF